MKKQQTIIAALALTIALQANAQNSRGGISSDMLSKIQKEQKLTAADNAIANAIAATVCSMAEWQTAYPSNTSRAWDMSATSWCSPSPKAS